MSFGIGCGVKLRHEQLFDERTVGVLVRGIRREPMGMRDFFPNQRWPVRMVDHTQRTGKFCIYLDASVSLR